MPVRTICPKCTSSGARYEKDRHDIILRCLCGYHKVVHSTLDSIEIEHRDSGKDITIPKKESKLWYCFMSLVALQEGSTRTIADSINMRVPVPQNMSEVSSQLTVLRYKGLVEVIDNRKGLIGGSTWQLTQKAKELTENT